MSDEGTDKLPEPDSGEESHGLIFNIQKFSLHDGSGIRTLVFLKGCPLGCRWCSNPEGRARLAELAYNLDKCIGVAECGDCIPRCPANAITEHGHDKIKCRKYMYHDIAYIKQEYGVDVQGCGLCQTKVPCEFRNPAKKLKV